ncbi:MAG: hypothetical protein ABR600_06255 [Actinomycetota bacterium]
MTPPHRGPGLVPGSFDVRPLTPERWRDFEAVMGKVGRTGNDKPIMRKTMRTPARRSAR